jgi:hypothetical protein
MMEHAVHIPIAGSIAQRVGQGGHAWVFLQYLLGFRRLGYEPLFIDRLTNAMCNDSRGRYSPARKSRAIRWFVDVMQRAGFGSSYTLLLDDDGETVGLSRAAVLQRIKLAPFLINVMGFITEEDILSAARRRIFLDIDPGFGQMWHELGLSNLFDRHDEFVTIGENIGQPGCTLPTCGLQWVTTPQPVALQWWPPVHGGSAFTSVMSWRGPYDAIEYKGHKYGLRVHEFRKFMHLPSLAETQFELALEIDDADEADIASLLGASWNLVDPLRVASDPWSYREYVQRSQAEVLVAKGIYVDTSSGWFSDRSICYLASGKPVLAQDTGFTRNYPTGEGLLSFRNVEEAAVAIHQICQNYDAHAAAARAIAREHFDSHKVLTRLLEKLGVP